MRIRGSMVPATDGRSGLRTGFGTGWYGQGMSFVRARPGPVTAAAIVVVAVVAGCLPPPRVANETATPVGSAAVASPSAVVPPPSAAPETQDVAIAAFAKQVASGK